MVIRMHAIKRFSIPFQTTDILLLPIWPQQWEQARKAIIVIMPSFPEKLPPRCFLPQPPLCCSVSFSIKMLILFSVSQVFWLQCPGSGFHRFKPTISTYMRRVTWLSMRFLLNSLVPLPPMMIAKRQSNFPPCGRKGPPFWSLFVILVE